MKKEEIHFEFPDKAKSMHQVLSTKSKEKIQKRDIAYPCHLMLDQSTNTGMALFDDKRRLVFTAQLNKDDKDSLYEYKMGLKEYLTDIISTYQVGNVWHEEAYEKANHHTTQVLYYIKHMISDLQYEIDRKIQVMGIDHARWKSLLAKPKSFKKGQDEKKQVRKLVKEYYPLLNLGEDMTDALGMGIALIWKNKEKDVRFNARINKTLPVYVEVLVLKEDESLIDRVESLGARFTNKWRREKGADIIEEDKEIHSFEYNTRHDEKMNARYFLHFKDAICWTEIPFHLRIGQILLHYGIIPKEIEETDKIVMVACRKK